MNYPPVIEVMMPVAGLFACAMIIAVAGVTSAEVEYRRRPGGWFWYRETPPDPAPEERTGAEPEPESPAFTAQLASFQAQLEESLARAVLQPSAGHLEDYMRLNARSLALAGRFAKVWQQVLGREPGLDYRLQYPASDQALQAWQVQREVEQDGALREVAATYGLWFFFRGDCPVCHRFAPVLRRFAGRYGFAVVAVSLDGGVLPEFPQPRRDLRAAARLKVVAVPALFLVQPQSRTFVAVGHGYMSATELRRQALDAAATAQATANSP